MRRLAFAAFVLLGSAFIVVGTFAALRGTPVAYRVEAPPTVDDGHEALTAAVRGCVEAHGRWVQGQEGSVLVARCVPSLGVYPVGRASK